MQMNDLDPQGHTDRRASRDFETDSLTYSANDVDYNGLNAGSDDQGGRNSRPEGHFEGNTGPRPIHSRHGPFAKLLLLWIWTAILTALVAATVNIYQSKGVLSPSQKSTYNIFTTILIVFLGLSFFESFKELARAAALQENLIRLSNGREEEMDLIRGFDSLLKVARLVGVTTAWGLRLFCLIWLVINLTAQVLSALVNLEATVEDGHDYHSTYFSQGNVSVANLSCYFHNSTCWGPVTIHALAHAYGAMALNSDCGAYGNFSDILKAKINYPYFCRHDQQEFAQRFYEYNPKDTQKAYPSFTKRIITASSGECTEYDQIVVAVDDQNPALLKYHNPRDSTDGNISIPMPYQGREGTTYIYRNAVDPQFVTEDCGDRCIWMWAYKNPGAKDGSKFYRCPITVSSVTNATQIAHQVPKNVAQVAAASIALQGQWRWRPKKDNQMDFTQFQFYASGHPLELHNHNASQAGSNMARFALGSLHTLINQNKPINITGTVPHLGSRINVEWGPLTAIFVCIVATHFVVFALTYWLA